MIRITGSAIGILESDAFPILTVLTLFAFCLSFWILWELEKRKRIKLEEQLFLKRYG
jgi:hypothetical protein